MCHGGPDYGHPKTKTLEKKPAKTAPLTSDGDLLAKVKAVLKATNTSPRLNGARRYVRQQRGEHVIDSTERARMERQWIKHKIQTGGTS
ncbi:MAG: hypothetical protein E5Y61_00940 [Mesorhizobium sp.]|nr:MAG: hypothetical protein E5Y61_00940 [Mesorhizobium sp.]TIM67034.1 MAG: hypothetical protein E5Y60_18750 [Mesorhizobium sp.]